MCEGNQGIGTLLVAFSFVVMNAPNFFKGTVVAMQISVKVIGARIGFFV